jgi:hypothetical protein
MKKYRNILFFSVAISSRCVPWTSGACGAENPGMYGDGSHLEAGDSRPLREKCSSLGAHRDEKVLIFLMPLKPMLLCAST